jgi:hypothetical protein
MIYCRWKYKKLASPNPPIDRPSNQLAIASGIDVWIGLFSPTHQIIAVIQSDSS